MFDVFFFFDCDNGFKYDPNRFYLTVMVFEFNLIAVKLVQEEALIDLLQSYYAAPNIVLY